MPKGIIGWLLIGLVAGALGKLVMPGRDPAGVVVTILIGMAGALLAFYLSPLVGVSLHGSWGGYVAATAGAVLLLALYRLVVVRRA